jgi:hypothetical protein
MAVQLQILQPGAADGVPPVFTAGGTALNMAQGAITVNALLVILDMSSPPVTAPAAVNQIGGAGPGVFTWSANFTAADNIQPGDYALFALAYDSTNTLAGQVDIPVTVNGTGPDVAKRKQKKTKTKKSNKKK